MAVLSHLARLGSSDPVELQTEMAELIDGFDISKFGSAPTKFDVGDLFPLTGRYLQSLPFDAVSSDIAGLGVPDDVAEAFWKVTRENIETMKDLGTWWSLCRDGAEPWIAAEDTDFVAQAVAI